MWWRRERARQPALELDRVRGCLWGGALGDALGARWENEVAPALPDVLEVGYVSDDTQLTLATASAIAGAGGVVDPAKVAAALLAWHRREGLRGVGAATAKAIRELALGGHWALVGRKGEMAAGNGAAIRVAPLALVLDPRERIARMHIRDVARITHHSDEAYAGALAICIAVHDSASSRPWDLRRIAEELPDSRVRDTLLEVEPGESVADCAQRFGNSGYVAESVPIALHAAASFGAAGFLPMMRAIVSSGGDCDSIASMAGQVWGARHGLEALPAELIHELPDGEVIREVVARFARVVRQA